MLKLPSLKDRKLPSSRNFAIGSGLFMAILLLGVGLFGSHLFINPSTHLVGDSSEQTSVEPIFPSGDAPAIPDDGQVAGAETSEPYVKVSPTPPQIKVVYLGDSSSNSSSSTTNSSTSPTPHPTVIYQPSVTPTPTLIHPTATPVPTPTPIGFIPTPTPTPSPASTSTPTPIPTPQKVSKLSSGSISSETETLVIDYDNLNSPYSEIGITIHDQNGTCWSAIIIGQFSPGQQIPVQWFKCNW